jgi:hypothetical protein
MFKKISSNQNGFAVLELVLVIIIVLGLGGIGWYVVSANHKTTTQLDAAAKESASTPAVKKSSGAPASTTSSNKFVFKEMGVEFDLPSDLKGMSYTVSHYSDGDAYGLTIASFTSANEQCYGQKIDGSGPTFASISKGSGTFSQDQYPVAQLLKQFDSSFVIVSYPNGITACDQPGVDPQLLFSKAHELQTSFVSAFKDSATLVQ